MHRGLAAACAAAVTCGMLYPLDVWKTAGQLRVRNMKCSQLYAGLAPELCGSFVGTGVYFTTYEIVRSAVSAPEPINTIAGSVCGVCTSYIVKSPLSLIKKRKQTNVALGVHVADYSRSLIRQTYLLDLCKALPRAIIKYVIYERLMLMMLVFFNRSNSAAASAAVASMIAYVVGTPFDNRKAFITVAQPIETLKGISFNGLGRGLVLSVLGNAIGHSLLEKWSPRM